jgi:hypothetical protein
LTKFWVAPEYFSIMTLAYDGQTSAQTRPSLWAKLQSWRKKKHDGAVQESDPHELKDCDLHELKDPDRPLVFMHIPKCSGIALVSSLSTSLKPRHVVGGFDRSMFGGFKMYGSLQPGLLQDIHTSPATLPKQADFIAGHFAYSMTRQAYPRAQFITVMREPITRVLSHWLYWRKHTDADLAPWGDWANDVRLARQPFETFLRAPQLACQTDNLILRMLLSPHRQIPNNDFIKPENDGDLIRAAMARLRDFDFVDFVENEDLAASLSKWLGRPMTYERVNETDFMPEDLRGPLHKELTRHVSDIITARTRLDLRIWTAVVARCLPGCDIDAIRLTALMKNVARYGDLMSA